MAMANVLISRTAVAAALALSLGCAGAEQSADHVAEQVSTDTSSSPAKKPPAGADLAGFPMPAAPEGEDHVAGLIRHTATGVDQHQTCAVRLQHEDGQLAVAVTGLLVNCCTETFRAAVVVTDRAVTVRLFQYLPDVCECTHRRDVSFELTDVGEAASLEVYLDDGSEPVATTSR
jgi:hypothetical protein